MYGLEGLGLTEEDLGKTFHDRVTDLRADGYSMNDAKRMAAAEALRRRVEDALSSDPIPRRTAADVVNVVLLLTGYSNFVDPEDV